MCTEARFAEGREAFSWCRNASVHESVLAVKLGEGDAVTEQEAETWVEKMGRIWEPEHIRRFGLAGSFPDKYFCFDAVLVQPGDHHVELFFVYIPFSINVDWRLRINCGLRITPHVLSARSDGLIIPEIVGLPVRPFQPQVQTALDQFVMDWLPFFRPRCWLSGCDIEASAHEKLEWIQGFNHEELETWGLKF